MNYLDKLNKLFFYAGLGKEDYETLTPRIHQENKVLLNVFSQIAAWMLFLLFFVSVFSNGFATINSSTYLISGIVMVLIMVWVRLVLPKHPEFVMVLVYLFEIVLYVFAIRISMLHADKPAVSAVAFLLVTPLLFYDRPSRLSALIAAVVAAFCAIVIRYKDPLIAETDVWNMITFGIVAIAATMFIMNVKIRALSQSREIETLSRTDLLTGLKNRNHYENQLEVYPKACTRNVICVYADVNGLHEMNNREGHAAGDRMLKETAALLQKTFTPEHAYRIGGDEFVAFKPDGDLEKVREDVERIRSELSRKGYHVSFGIAVWDKAEGNANMRETVKEAENNMFIAKRKFYSQPENNRRNR